MRALMAHSGPSSMKPLLRHQSSRYVIWGRGSCKVEHSVRSIGVQKLIWTNSGYNPPPFVINAAKEALNKVDCNQYSPTKVLLMRLG